MKHLTFLLLLISFQSFAKPNVWPLSRAHQWLREQGQLVGSNYIPENAVNSLEMWQKETFDPAQIDRELGWAESLGMNTMRVFLHDLIWINDSEGFKARIDTFLKIAEKHHIRPLLVLFDSCWDPHPHLGTQPAPRPGVHNSRWVQSPGLDALRDSTQYARLETYVKGVIGAFANDTRILGWDLWNEPDNLNGGSYNDPNEKVNFVQNLLPQVFAWARSVNPVQPLTSAVWSGNWTSDATLRPIEKIQLTSSDIITFHDYDTPSVFTNHVQQLKRYARPVVCTEYMARPLGSTFQSILPIAFNAQVGAINWGFVAGKTQTYIPWDSWQKPYPPSGPPVWFHDVFYSNGAPYNQNETNFIRRLMGVKTSTREAAL